MILRQAVKITLACAVAVVLFPVSCAPKKDYGQSIELSLTPNYAIFDPGPDATCIDGHNDAVAASSGTIITASRSAKGPNIKYNNFCLTWKSADTFYISALRVTVEGSGIPGGKVQTSYSPDEVDSMFALPAGNNGNSSGKIVGNQTICSNGSAATRGAFWPGCGLVVPSVALTDGTKTRSFRARVTIEAIGTAEDSSHTLSFIRQKTSGSADYISY